MAIVPPIPQYVSSASFLSLQTVTFDTHAISVTVAKEHFRPLDILFDGMPLNCIWNEIVNLDDCVVGFGCNMNVTAGSHTVSHRAEGGLLSVMAYGFDSTPLQGYAYTAGMNVQLREQSVNETGMECNEQMWYDPGSNIITLSIVKMSYTTDLVKLILYNHIHFKCHVIYL